ncbi:MAG: sugar ABC transporter substrate-binding protein [Clostridiales bacterium]|nr:sugar ABC transporter substrate-binding protein [Clostridiales bacterium]
MKKAVVFFMTCTLLASALAGCGAKDETADNGTKDTASSETAEEGSGKIAGKLTFATTEDREKIYQPVFDAFCKEYPDVEVEIATSVDFTAMNQGIQAAHQAGDDYDLMLVNHVDTMTYQKAGILYPVGELAEKDGVKLDEIFMGSMLEACTIDGKAYTVPGDTDTRVMAFNKELFEKYNLEYPTTMEEMLECGKTMAQNGDYLFCNALTSSAYQSTYEMGVFLQSIGGRLYEIDESGKAVATVDTPEMKEYLEFVQELMQYMPEDSTTTKDARAQFCNGNVGMYIFGPWDYTEIDMEGLDFTIDLATIPAGKAGAYSTSGGFQLGIGAGTDNLDAAWAFVKWLCENPEQSSAWAKIGLPTIEAAYNEGEFAEEKYQIFKEQLETSNVPQIPVANLGEVVECFDEYWQNLLFGKMTPEEVCKEAQTAVQELLDENE